MRIERKIPGNCSGVLCWLGIGVFEEPEKRLQVYCSLSLLAEFPTLLRLLLVVISGGALLGWSSSAARSTKVRVYRFGFLFDFRSGFASLFFKSLLIQHEIITKVSNRQSRGFGTVDHHQNRQHRED
jgi:hypothetical protein